MPYIEINAAAWWLTTLLPSLAEPDPGGLLDFGRNSCEHLAARITEGSWRAYIEARVVRILADGPS